MHRLLEDAALEANSSGESLVGYMDGVYTPLMLYGCRVRRLGGRNPHEGCSSVVEASPLAWKRRRERGFLRPPEVYGSLTFVLRYLCMVPLPSSAGHWGSRVKCWGANHHRRWAKIQK